MITINKYRIMLIVTFFFNLIDTLSTLYLVSLGLEEANPACRFLLSISPVLFAVVKIIGMGFIVWGLWRLRAVRFTQIATWVPFTAYGLLAAYHGFIIYNLYCLNLL